MLQFAYIWSCCPSIGAEGETRMHANRNNLYLALECFVDKKCKNTETITNTGIIMAANSEYESKGHLRYNDIFPTAFEPRGEASPKEGHKMPNTRMHSRGEAS